MDKAANCIHMNAKKAELSYCKFVERMVLTSGGDCTDCPSYQTKAIPSDDVSRYLPK